MKTVTQKIIKVGNSLAVTLNNEFVREASLKQGDPVTMTYNPSAPSTQLSFKDSGTTSYSTGNKLTFREKNNNLSSEITPEFQDWVKKTLKEDAEAMKKLANL